MKTIKITSICLLTGFFLVMILLMFSCTKEKKKDTCTTNTAIIGTWAQDSIIQGGLKYKTPYSGLPNTAQEQIQVTSTNWSNLQFSTKGTTLKNSFAIELVCDKVRVQGEDGYSFEIMNNGVLHTTAIPGGQQYFYHAVK